MSETELLTTEKFVMYTSFRNLDLVSEKLAIRYKLTSSSNFKHLQLRFRGMNSLEMKVLTPCYSL